MTDAVRRRLCIPLTRSVIFGPQRLPFLPETIMADKREVCDYAKGVIREGFLRVGRPVLGDSAAIVPFRAYGVGTDLTKNSIIQACGAARTRVK